MFRAGWLSLIYLLLALAISQPYGGNAADIKSIDDANSTTGQANGIPQRVAPNIYIETSPLGTYSADLSRFARRDSNDALITYASARGFKSIAVSGFSRETSDWTITAQYTVDGQPLQQKSFTIENVTSLTVVDDTDPNNHWQSWVLTITLDDSCPTDVGLVLSGTYHMASVGTMARQPDTFSCCMKDSEGDNGWGLQVGRIVLLQSSDGCVRSATPASPAATKPTTGATVKQTSIQVPVECIPKVPWAGVAGCCGRH
jgi:hypothetical protein